LETAGLTAGKRLAGHAVRVTILDVPNAEQTDDEKPTTTVH
jgi:hypothetical protein